MRMTSSRRPHGFVVALIAAALLGSAPARADSADVCTSPEEAIGATHPLSNITVFACLQAGTHTIPELGVANWEIVSVSPMAGNDGTGQYVQYYQLVIQSGDTLFDNGFD
jgi:hypothetical protein